MLHPEPLLSSAVPTVPWDIVGADLGTINGTTYLMVQYAYSSYAEVVILTDTSSSSVVKHLKSIFAGVPTCSRRTTDPIRLTREPWEMSNSKKFKFL